MMKKFFYRIELLVYLALVIISATFVIYCTFYGDRRLPTAIIALFGTSALLIKAAYTRKMKKTIIATVIAAIAIIVIVGSVYVNASISVKEIKNSISNANEVNITLNDFRTGESLQVTKASLKGEIIEKLMTIESNGLTRSKALSSSGYDALSLVVTTEEGCRHFVFPTESSDYIDMKGPFSYRILSNLELYMLIDKAFRSISLAE